MRDGAAGRLDTQHYTVVGTTPVQLTLDPRVATGAVEGRRRASVDDPRVREFDGLVRSVRAVDGAGETNLACERGVDPVGSLPVC